MDLCRLQRSLITATTDINPNLRSLKSKSKEVEDQLKKLSATVVKIAIVQNKVIEDEEISRYLEPKEAKVDEVIENAARVIKQLENTVTYDQNSIKQHKNERDSLITQIWIKSRLT